LKQTAESLGMGPAFLKHMEDDAKASGVSVEQLRSALQGINNAVADFQLHGPKLQELFRNIAPGALQATKKAVDELIAAPPEARPEMIQKFMKNYEDALRKMRDSEGRSFSESSIQTYINKALEAFDANRSILDTRFTHMSVELKRAIDEMIGAGNKMSDAWGDVWKKVGEMNALFGVTTTIMKVLAQDARDIEAAVNAINALLEKIGLGGKKNAQGEDVNPFSQMIPAPLGPTRNRPGRTGRATRLDEAPPDRPVEDHTKALENNTEELKKSNESTKQFNDALKNAPYSPMSYRGQGAQQGLLQQAMFTTPQFGGVGGTFGAGGPMGIGGGGGGGAGAAPGGGGPPPGGGGDTGGGRGAFPGAPAGPMPKAPGDYSPAAPPEGRPGGGGAKGGGGGTSLVEETKKFEGFEPKAKWDYHQYSYGYGTKAPGAGATITREEAEKQLQGELSKAGAAVDKINPNLDAGTKAALTDFAFNAGPGRLKPIEGAIAAGDTEAIKKWLPSAVTTAGGKQLPALVTRRAKEASWVGNKDFGKAPDKQSSATPDQQGTTQGVPGRFAADLAAMTLAGGKPHQIRKWMQDRGINLSEATCGQFMAAVVKEHGGTPPKDAAVASNWNKFGEEGYSDDPNAINIAVRQGTRIGSTGSHVTGVVPVKDESGKITGYRAVGANQGEGRDVVSSHPLGRNFAIRHMIVKPREDIEAARKDVDQAQTTEHKINGNASLDVNVNAPKNTDVRAKANGIFKSPEVRRQTQMQPAASGPSDAMDI
jgi:GH24 family phage-related lysozyme (muramidase)